MKRLSRLLPGNSKVRIRSQEELRNQRQLLMKVADVLEEQQFEYILASGTLLGLYRDGDLIPWDWDLQLYFCSESLLPRLSEFESLLQQTGLSVQRCLVRGETQEIKVLAFMDAIKLEVTSWTRQGELRVRQSSQLPAHLFEEVSWFEFDGRFFRTFGNPEEYLVKAYGDWRTPVRTSHKKSYLARDFFADGGFGVLVRLVRPFLRMVGRLRADSAMKAVARQKAVADDRLSAEAVDGNDWGLGGHGTPRDNAVS